MLRALGILAVGVSTLSGAEVYRILPTPESRVALTVEKTGLMSGKRHLFLFERYSGTVLYDAARPEQSKVEIRIEAKSAVCKDTWVSRGDLQKIERVAKDEMMIADKHPELVFTSQRVERAAADAYRVHGTLTIRGIQKPVAVNVRLLAAEGALSQAQGGATVSMKAYGMKPPTAALGLIGTKDEMAVDFTLRLSADTALSRTPTLPR